MPHFANGQRSTTVTLGSSGSESVLVKSTGQMGRYFNDHQLGSIAVAINAKGITRHISLLTEQNYQQLAIQYLENVYTGTPPPLAAGPGEQLLNIIIPSAHAGLFDDIWDGVVGVVEFLIPIEAMGEVVTQLSLLAQNSPLFDPSKLIFSSLELLTIFRKRTNNNILAASATSMVGVLSCVYDDNTNPYDGCIWCLLCYLGQWQGCGGRERRNFLGR